VNNSGNKSGYNMNIIIYNLIWMNFCPVRSLELVGFIPFWWPDFSAAFYEWIVQRELWVERLKKVWKWLIWRILNASFQYASILGYPLNIRVSWPHIAMTRFLHDTLRYSNVAAENPAIIDPLKPPMIIVDRGIFDWKNLMTPECKSLFITRRVRNRKTFGLRKRHLQSHGFIIKYHIKTA
jgi:hypothetical protein